MSFPKNQITVVVSEMERDGFIDRFTCGVAKLRVNEGDADATSLSRDICGCRMLLLTDWIKWSRCIGNVILLILVGRGKGL